jgi:hypothetical protein
VARTGFCSARALATFITRPQAAIQIGATKS